MFDILNTLLRLRKYSPQVCKFLVISDRKFHACAAVTRRCSYLLEQVGFRDRALEAIGLPIALPLPPALVHVCKGKG